MFSAPIVDLPAAVKALKPKTCLACDKLSFGHVRVLKNVARRPIFKDLISILCVVLPEDLSNLFICETCLRAVQNIVHMRQTCQKNLAIHQNLQRQKGSIDLSVSSMSEKVEQIQNVTREEEKHVEHNYNSDRSKCRISKRCIFVPSTNTTPVKLTDSSSDQFDHNYAYKADTDLSAAEMYNFHHQNILQECEFSENDERAVRNVCEFRDSSVGDFMCELFNIPSVKKYFWRFFLTSISSELDRLCCVKDRSVLRMKLSEIDCNTFLDELTREIHHRCPKVFDFLVAMSTPVHIQLPADSRVIAAMYAMAMYCRNPQMIAFQKVIASACVGCNAGNSILGFLNMMSISIPETSRISLLNDICRLNGDEVVDARKNGHAIKITVDDTDGRIKAYQMPPKCKAAGGAAKGGKKAKKEEPAAAPAPVKDAAAALKVEDKKTEGKKSHKMPLKHKIAGGAGKGGKKAKKEESVGAPVTVKDAAATLEAVDTNIVGKKSLEVDSVCPLKVKVEH